MNTPRIVTGLAAVLFFGLPALVLVGPYKDAFDPEPPAEVRYVTNRANHTEKPLASNEAAARELLIKSQDVLIATLQMQLRLAKMENNHLTNLPIDLNWAILQWVRQERDYWRSLALGLEIPTNGTKPPTVWGGPLRTTQ